MLGDIMNYSNISKKPVNTINPSSSRYSFTLPKKHINLNFTCKKQTLKI